MWRILLSGMRSVAASSHWLRASYREALVEHLVVGEVLRHLWQRGVATVEVLKPQVDDGGYDIVLECRGVVRHIQLKSSRSGAATASQKLNLGLASKPGGCLLWVVFASDSINPAEFRYLWFGASPGKGFPDIGAFRTARHTKGNAKGTKTPRPNIRVIPKSAFKRLDSVESLVERLFGLSPPTLDRGRPLSPTS